MLARWLTDRQGQCRSCARVRNEIRRALVVLDRAGRIAPDHLLLLQATTEDAPRFRNAIIDDALSEIVRRIRQDHNDRTPSNTVNRYVDEQAAVDEVLQLLRG